MKKESEDLLFETSKSRVKMSMHHAVRELPSTTVTVNRERITTPSGYAHSVLLKLNGRHFAQKSEFSANKELTPEMRAQLISDVLVSVERWADEGVKELKSLAK
jgi:hypothetical protein